MKFKTGVLAAEFHGDNLDARLRAVILELDLQVSRKFAKELTVTHVLRTPEEQAALNKSASDVKANMAKLNI